jgi:hypothetical protein
MRVLRGQKILYRAIEVIRLFDPGEVAAALQ